MNARTNHTNAPVRTARLAIAGLAMLVGVGVLAPSAAHAATIPSINCAYGSATFRTVDNSGFDRSFSMNHSLTKYCGAHAKTQYKMNFGSGVSTSWHDGLERFSNGSESGVVTDNFYYSNAARGAWVRVCTTTNCGSSTYVDNPYN